MVKQLLCMVLVLCFNIGVDGFSLGNRASFSAMRHDRSILRMTKLVYKGKGKNFKPGSPLKKACSALGVKPKFSCKKGDCGSCAISIGGVRAKVCVGKVPAEPRLKSLIEKGLEIK